MASSHRGRVRFGPAGWSYRDWEGVVYPRPHRKDFDPLAYLAGFFDTVEVNTTFYRPATAAVARTWARRVAHNPDFQFTAKLWRRFTHQREAWTREEVKQTRAGLEALAAHRRLGAVLIQFPWSFRRTEENRAWLRDVVREFDDLPLVLEVRHASWNVPDFYAALAEQGLGFVNIDQPLFKNSLPPSARVTSHVAYVRVHGRNYHDWFRQAAGRDDRYNYLYTARQLEPWAERIDALARAPETRSLFVVTNNHFRGKAPANALMLQSLVQHRPVEGPPQLVEEYAETLQGLVLPRAGAAPEHEHPVGP